MPNCLNKVKNDITDDTCRRCAEINVIKTKENNYHGPPLKKTTY